jgi:peptide/nickel transport system substrate-binding protein
MHKFHKFGSALVGAALVLSACSGAGSQSPPASSATPASGQQSAPKSISNLVIATVRDPDTLDTQRTTWVDIANNIAYEPLVSRDESGKIVPNLAESWEISPDGKVWTFHLRKGVKFHSGAPFNAEAVKKTYDRMMAKETASPVAYMLGPLKQIDVVDEFTVKLTFSEAYAPFWAPLTNAYLAPYDPTVLEKEGLKFGENPSAAGPYKFKERTRGSSLTYVKNPDYSTIMPYVKNQGVAKFDSITIRVIPDEQTRVLELEKGNIHIVTSLPPQEVKRLEGNKDLSIIRQPENGIWYLGFNNEKAPFTDKAVRAAISMAIDRRPMVEVAMEGLAQPVYGPLPSTIPGYSEAVDKLAQQTYPYDVNKAKQVLTDDGYKPGADGMMAKGGKPLGATLWITNEPVQQRLAQMIQSQLKQIGFAVKIEVLEDAAIRAGTPEGKHEMILWTYGWTDPDILYYLFKTGQSTRLHFSTPDLDKLVEDGRKIVDESKRMAVYEQAQKYLIEQEPWVPLFVRQNAFGIRKDIKDARVHKILGGLILQDLGW